MNKFILFLLFYILFIYGCKKIEIEKNSNDSGHYKVLTDSDVITDFIPPQSEYNTVERCPVMGDKVIVGKDTKAVKYKEKIFYFCCPECISKFKSEPEKYSK
ncbi:MAG: hypothetical protein A2474_03725 [Elusimicrobia bacterium RIFOXYC2_FULL_34_12]|nr:MAG: hypothetical protein A2474_03725 [Elusimicrobia bacterium RIFOXYC2_FULL_34_12]OGS38681.1 MAG: hypothetical protein A2551_05220 [Elusimicrobia bacterium RIFOXYD2_FULL_34_30]